MTTSLQRDANRVPVLGGVYDDGSNTIAPLLINASNGRLKVTAIFAGASGTVTTVSVVTANGVSGSVANPTTTPAITITLGAITPTTVNGNTFTTGSSTYTGTAGQTYTFPSTSQTIVGLTSTQTLTNKNITRRFVTTTQSATPAINTDNGDIFSITGLAQAVTSFTTNLTGTPVAGQLMMIQITDDGSARGLTWGAKFASTTVTLPTTTVISTLLRVGFQWDTVAAVWQCIAVV